METIDDIMQHVYEMLDSSSAEELTNTLNELAFEIDARIDASEIDLKNKNRHEPF